MANILRNIIHFLRRPVKDTYQPEESRNFSHLYPKDNVFPEVFFSNLVKTITWTNSILSQTTELSTDDYSTVMRTTNPDYEGNPFYKFGSGFASPPELCFNYLPVLEAALKTRIYNTSNIPIVNTIGKVLEFDIDVTTQDGAPCQVSNGFVDEADIPPIDTWFYLTKTHLYCWIPDHFVETMRETISVEILDSYRWIEDSNPQLQARVIGYLSTKP